MHGNDKHQIQDGGHMGAQGRDQFWDWGRDTQKSVIISSIFFFKNVFEVKIAKC